MRALALERCRQRVRLGLKGPRAAEWLAAQGIVLPAAANTWSHAEAGTGADGLLVARLGESEFFLEDDAAGATLQRLAPSLNRSLPGVYPVLREDAADEMRAARMGVVDALKHSAAQDPLRLAASKNATAGPVSVETSLT